MKLELLAKCLNELIKNRPEFADKDICIEQTADGESKLYVTQYDETSKKWTKLYWIKNLNTIKESIMTKNMKKTYKVKNYKGNIVESLKKFSESHKGMKIVEAKEADNELKIKVKESMQTFDDTIKNEILKVFENNVDLEKDYDTSFVVITKNLNPTKIGYIRDDLHKLLDKYPNLSWDEDDGDNGFYSRKYTFYFVDE